MVDPLFFVWKHMNILFVCLNVLFVKQAGGVCYDKGNKSAFEFKLGGLRVC